MANTSNEEISSLKKSNEAKGRFISILSHNIKAPLNYFHHVASFLEKNWDTLSDNEKKESILALSESSEAMINLVQQVLIWSKARLPQEEEKASYTNLKDTLKEVFDIYSGQSRLKELELVSELKGDIVVSGDRRVIHLILQNIVSNAVKFSFTNDRIVGYVENECSLVIQDFGMGMSPEELEKLNNPNITFTRKGTHNEEGTGVGMAIVYDLLPMVGASISFSSETNVGTLAKITFKKL